MPSVPNALADRPLSAYFTIMGETIFRILAIDGGAASGKSTTARALSARFHFLHVDTGEHYRALTAFLLSQHVAASEDEVIRCLEGVEVGTQVDGREAHIRINGSTAETLTLRSPEVNAQVSAFAALPPIREKLLPYQREQVEVARRGGFKGLVMEGRDIGSVVFPDADLRVFLEADPRTRTERRALEGWSDPVKARDQADSGRSLAPLTCAPGAYRIDTARHGVDEVVDKISSLLETEPAASAS